MSLIRRCQPTSTRWRSPCFPVAGFPRSRNENVHELGLVEGIRETVLTHARAAGVRRVVSVRVMIAEDSSYLEEAVAMFWDETCRDTELGGAQIDLVRMPGQRLCLACSARFAVTGADCRCPECGSHLVRPSDAVECYVESIEVES